jgi:hypothetical protein
MQHEPLAMNAHRPRRIRSKKKVDLQSMQRHVQAESLGAPQTADADKQE